MIKKIILSTFLSPILYAQSVGINTETPNRSAVLDIAPFLGETARIEAKINSDGTLSNEFNIINPGYGYKTAPEVIIAGGGPSVTRGGVRATATAEIDEQGRITKINLTNAGSNYYTAPEITLINNESMGWAIPRVDLPDVKDNNYPVKITDEEADGLLVYNAGENNNYNTTFWYDKNDKEWHEGVTANKTPKISIFEFTADEDVAKLNGRAGEHSRILKATPFKEPISNILGVDAEKYNNDNTYVIKLPNTPSTYVIEINLNLTTNPYDTDYAYDSSNSCHYLTGVNCSKAINSEGYNIMGYFLQMEVRNAQTEYSKVGQTIRKEVPIIAKIGSPHKASWIISVQIDPTTTNSSPYLEFYLGRMDGSTHHQPATILAEGSFIKIQQN